MFRENILKKLPNDLVTKCAKFAALVFLVHWGSAGLQSYNRAEMTAGEFSRSRCIYLKIVRACAY